MGSWRRSIQQRTLNETGAPGEKINWVVMLSKIAALMHVGKGQI